MQVEIALKKRGGVPVAEVLSSEVVDNADDVIRLYFGPVTVDITDAEALLFGKELSECGVEAKTLRSKLHGAKATKAKSLPAPTE